jgi:hypothetical protein
MSGGRNASRDVADRDRRTKMNRSLGSRYVLHEVLGRGAMGEVFRGSVRESGAPVAVKVLKAELVADPEVVSRFVQERSILVSINHPNVVRVIDLVVEGETLGIVMELVRGRDLRRALAEDQPHPPAMAIHLFRQLLAGLTAVHTAGVLHRDIKPENLLLDLSAGRVRVKLTDFGVARLTYGTALTRTTGLIGTPEYMAPETAEHGTATVAADLYSAGIVLYEMLAGRTPFRGGPPLAVLRRQVEDAPAPIPGLPIGLWSYIESLLAKDPSARPRSASQAADTLLPLEPELAGLPALPPMTAWPGAEGGRRMSVAADTGQAYLTTTSLAGPASRETVLRQRDRRSQPGVITATAPGHARSDYPGAAAVTDHRPRRSGWSRLRKRPVAVWMAAVVVAVLAAVVGLVIARSLARSPSHPAAVSRPLPTASYTFPPQRYSTGLVVARRWTLSGKDGTVLTETTTLRSATGKALSTWFKDSIPAAITNSMQALRFSVTPAKIVSPDPVVEWYVRLPAHGTVTVGYVASVPPQGATAARLASWAKGLNAVEERLNTPARKHQQAPSPTPSPTQAASNGQNPNGQPTSNPGNPTPYPTYTCDPQQVTCSTQTPTPAPGFGGGGF